MRKNVAGQNITFALTNVLTGAPLTGATPTVYRCLDNGAQAAATGSVTEKGNGQYSFAPSQADTNANSAGYLAVASGAFPVDLHVFPTSLDPTNPTTGGLGNLDAAVSGRASQTSLDSAHTKLDTIDDFLDTEIAAIKAKTDNLPADPADASDIAASFATVNTKLDTVDDFLDTEIAAIKAKTDALPADPADASDVAAAIAAVSTKLDTIDDFLDTEVAAIKAKTDLLPAQPAAVGSEMAIASSERDAIAAAVLKLDWTTITGEASRSVLNALRFLRNKWAIGTDDVLHVKKEDDTTDAWTAAVTKQAGNPVDSVDPS